MKCNAATVHPLLYNLAPSQPSGLPAIARRAQAGLCCGIIIIVKLLLVVASLAGALTVTPFVTAQDIEPAADVFEVDAKAEAYYYYCIARMHERQFEATQAIESYEEAARLDPESAYPHVALASLYQRTRQLDMALEAVKHAIELEPDVAAAQRILGMLYFAMLRNGGSPELAPQAIDAFRETVRLDPRRSRLENIRLQMSSPALGHLAPAGFSRATRVFTPQPPTCGGSRMTGRHRSRRSKPDRAAAPGR